MTLDLVFRFMLPVVIFILCVVLTVLSGALLIGGWSRSREARRIANQKIEFGTLWVRTRPPASVSDPAMIISANQQEITFACLGFLTWPSPARHVYTSVYTRDLFLFAFRRVEEE